MLTIKYFATRVLKLKSQHAYKQSFIVNKLKKECEYKKLTTREKSTTLQTAFGIFITSLT